MNAFYCVLTLMLLGFGSQGREVEQPQVANLDTPAIERQDVSRPESGSEAKSKTSRITAKGSGIKR